ncbi:MAG: pentapeptide repeat-containing protein [Deltaproteobacteria bacterium]|nr:pentapeptide repeat-containing protein [Deltaproteobacteria bacterium]
MHIVNETSFAAALAEAPNPKGGGLMMIVKGAFAVTSGARARPLPRPRPDDARHGSFPYELGGEQPFESAPQGSCRYPSDFAPYKPAADVMVVSTFGGAGGTERRVKLRVGSLTKLLEVRAAGAGKQLFGLAPLGGPTATSLAASGTYDAHWRATRWPWFPADFNWNTFQSAPSDQRVAGYLRGDELVQFQGHADAPIRTYLPALRPRAFVRQPRSPAAASRAVVEIPLVLDTLWLDADAGAFVLVWRGHVPGLRAEDRMAALVAAESLEEPAAPLEAFAAEERWQPKPSEPDPATPEGLDAADEVTLAKDAVVDAGTSSDEAAEVANALELMREARLPPEVLARAESATSLASLVAILDGSLSALEATAVREETTLDRAREFLRANGQDPSLLDAAEDPTPSPSPAAPSAPTREDVLARLAAGENLSGADLRGLDLSNANLSNARMDGANLDGAILDGASLEGADLTDATLLKTRAAGARFDGAVLERANLEGLAARGASFVGASLTRARLPNATLISVNFSQADLTGALLTGSTLEGASMRGVELDGAELQLTVLRGSDAREGSFRKADLTGADLEGATLDGANFAGARLDRAKLDGVSAIELRLEGTRGEAVSWRGADLSRSRASRDAMFSGADFRDVRADDANWSEAGLGWARFDGATLRRALFRGAELEGSSFHLATLVGADFTDAKLARAHLTKVNAYQGRFPRADLGEADCRASNFFECEFWQTNVAGTRFERSILARTKLEPEEMT